MTKVTINNQFHYITVKIVFPSKQTCNMTWSHSGMKLSGSAEWGPHGKAIMRAMECPKGTDIGHWTKQVAAASAKAASVAELTMMTQARAYVAGWNACMDGVDGRYAQQFVKNVNGPAVFADSTPYQVSADIRAAWTHGWLDAMEAEDGEEPEAAWAGY